MMFIDKHGNLYIGEMRSGDREATADEVSAWESDRLKNKLKQDAQDELDKITGPRGTIIRCVVAGVPVPAVWASHVFKLRAIANGTDTTSTALPNQPAFPPGT